MNMNVNAILNRMNLRRDIAVGILLIAAGALFCWNPLWAPKLVLMVLGGFLVADGALSLYRYFEERKVGAEAPFPIKEIVEIIGGVYLLGRTNQIISLVLGALGAVLLIGGFIQAKRVWSRGRGLLGGLLALLLIFTGISMIANPMGAASKVFARLGVLLILCGVIRLITADRTEPAREPAEIFDME